MYIICLFLALLVAQARSSFFSPCFFLHLVHFCFLFFRLRCLTLLFAQAREQASAAYAAYARHGLPHAETLKTKFATLFDALKRGAGPYIELVKTTGTKVLCFTGILVQVKQVN